MKMLIAKRSIQYMGKVYERGEVIPAQDTKMVAAWLKADSAAWVGDTQEVVADVAKVVQEAARRSRVNDMAAEAIRAMGVTVEDDAGEFVGASNLEEQIRALFGPGSLQDGGDGEEGQELTEGGSTAQDGQEMPGEAENSESGGTPPVASISLMTGHLDAADLEKWRKGDLEKLAADMGVDISKAKNNAERAAILAAVEVQVPANAPENYGGAR